MLIPLSGTAVRYVLRPVPMAVYHGLGGNTGAADVSERGGTGIATRTPEDAGGQRRHQAVLHSGQKRQTAAAARPSGGMGSLPAVQPTRCGSGAANSEAACPRPCAGFCLGRISLRPANQRPWDSDGHELCPAGTEDGQAIPTAAETGDTGNNRDGKSELRGTDETVADRKRIGSGFAGQTASERPSANRTRADANRLRPETAAVEIFPEKI